MYKREKKILNVTYVILKSTTRKVLYDTKGFWATHSLSGGMLQFNNIYLYKCQKVGNNLKKNNLNNCLYEFEKIYVMHVISKSIISEI